MAKSERVIFLTFPDAELLDLAGPVSVFSLASDIESNANYECIVASADGGLVNHSAGISLDSCDLASLNLRKSDSVFAVGGRMEAINSAAESKVFLDFLRKAASKAKRIGSICSGTFLLGEAGLLRSKQVVTHWLGTDELGSRFEGSIVNPDALYVNDGKLWTSAGVTSGIDMALAIVELDHGPVLRSRIAKLLVVYSHRPGNQAQFSELLVAQTRIDQDFKGLVKWILKNLSKPPSAEQMAEFVGMSTRSFYRKFTDLMGVTPGKFVEKIRLDRARQLLASGKPSKSVAAEVGFKSDSAFRKAFKFVYGVTPGQYAAMQ
ncbi:MAG: DJ-1/PfpI family protein [Pseudomonadales bacterium]|nr:DJ-1/PfpI family protein [Pseudomonadales bacterium]